jgi:Flp pilus assembly protein TadG
MKKPAELKSGSDDGSALIEFALILPLAVLMLAYMVDYALWIQKAMQLQDAASAAAAYGAIPGNSSNSSQMTTLANFIVTGSPTGAAWLTVNATDFYTCSPGGAQVTATTSCPTGAPYHYVQVTTSATQSSLLGFRAIASSLPLSGAATYRVEVTP